MMIFAKVSASGTVSEGGNEQTTRGNLTIEVIFTNTDRCYHCKTRGNLTIEVILTNIANANGAYHGKTRGNLTI